MTTRIPHDSDAERRALDDRIAGIDGWLDRLEAWELHEAARARAARGSSIRVVEIGSWLGRSTIALGSGLLAGGTGRVFAVDPHQDADERHEEFLANIERAGVSGVVEPVRLFSHQARSLLEDGTVDVLFVDGSHEYHDVLLDIDTWRSALRPGAIVAFNDPWLPGVARALIERVATRSGFRQPRVVVNTVFCVFDESDWTAADERSARRLRWLLRVGRWWLPFHHRLIFTERVPMRVKQWNVRVAVFAFRRILPSYQPSDGPYMASTSDTSN